MRQQHRVFYMPAQLGWSIAGNYETLHKLLRDDRLSLRFADWRFYPRAAEDKKTELDKLTDNLLMSNTALTINACAACRSRLSPRIVNQLMHRRGQRLTF